MVILLFSLLLNINCAISNNGTNYYLDSYPAYTHTGIHSVDTHVDNVVYLPDSLINPQVYKAIFKKQLEEKKRRIASCGRLPILKKCFDHELSMFYEENCRYVTIIPDFVEKHNLSELAVAKRLTSMKVSGARFSYFLASLSFEELPIHVERVNERKWGNDGVILLLAKEIHLHFASDEHKIQAIHKWIITHANYPEISKGNMFLYIVYNLRRKKYPTKEYVPMSRDNLGEIFSKAPYSYKDYCAAFDTYLESMSSSVIKFLESIIPEKHEDPDIVAGLNNTSSNVNTDDDEINTTIITGNTAPDIDDTVDIETPEHISFEDDAINYTSMPPENETELYIPKR